MWSPDLVLPCLRRLNLEYGAATFAFFSTSKVLLVSLVVFTVKSAPATLALRYVP